MTSVSRLAGPRVETNRRPIRRRTAAESATHDDIIRFFFRGLFLFGLFFFCYPLPLFFFISIFWRGARGAQNEAKDAANPRNGKTQNPQKSSILEVFFCAGKRRKAFELVDAAVFRGAGGEKSQNYWGGAVTPKGPLSPPPTQERGSGGYPPETPFCPPFSGGALPFGGGRSPPPLSRFLAIHWHLYVSFYLLSYYSSYLLPS